MVREFWTHFWQIISLFRNILPAVKASVHNEKLSIKIIQIFKIIKKSGNRLYVFDKLYLQIITFSWLSQRFQIYFVFFTCRLLNRLTFSKFSSTAGICRKSLLTWHYSHQHPHSCQNLTWKFKKTIRHEDHRIHVIIWLTRLQNQTQSWVKIQAWSQLWMECWICLCT